MDKPFFRFKTRDIVGIVTCITGITLYKYSNITRDLFLTNSHPTQKYTEMLIKLDNRITNFCGFNYQISGFKLIENTEKYQSYRMNLKGIRGDCKVLVKVQKLDNEELNFLSDQQKKISLMSYELRKKEPFIPIDLTDVLIPTENSMKNLNERIENFAEKFKNKLILLSQTLDENRNVKSESLQVNIFNENKYGKLYEGKQFELFEKLNSLAENKEILKEYVETIRIRDTDCFYRFINISVSYSDNAIFNIRPLNAKFRDYEIIDTEFTDKTYLDILKKLLKVQHQFENKNNYEVSAEELKNELKTSKQNYFREKLEKRKNLMKWQLLTLICVVFFYKSYFKYVNCQRIYKGVVENLSKNKKLKQSLGDNFYIPYVSFKYNLFQKNFKFNCVAMNGENKIIVIGKSLPNAENVLPNIKYFDDKKNPLKF